MAWPKSPNSGFATMEADANASDKRYHVDFLKNAFNDFARPNLYKIEFVLPTAANSFGYMSSDYIFKTEMTAKTVNIPAFDIGKLDIKRCGQHVSLPTTQNYGDVQLSLMCDDNYTQRKFLHSWMKHIIYDTDSNVYGKIHDILSCKMRIKQLDNQFNVIFAAEFNRVWPSSIGEIQLSSDSDSQIVEFPATFSYSTYTILTPEAG